MAQKITFLGAPDPRVNETGSLDIRLAHLLKFYEKEDPPPARLQPMPLGLIKAATTRIPLTAPIPISTARDMTIIGFFFLMRPGEYCTSGDSSHPFLVKDVILWKHQERLDHQQATYSILEQATSCQLTFTTQKNAVRGERVGHAATSDPIFCPVKALVRRIIHLRRNEAPVSTPIHCYFLSHQTVSYHLPSTAITRLLKLGKTFTPTYQHFPDIHLKPRSLRASGAMALLAAGIDSNVLRLMGRWQSDAMLRYLHTQVLPITHSLSQRMLLHGDFQSFESMDISHLL